MRCAQGAYQADVHTTPLMHVSLCVQCLIIDWFYVAPATTRTRLCQKRCQLGDG